MSETKSQTEPVTIPMHGEVCERVTKKTLLQKPSTMLLAQRKEKKKLFEERQGLEDAKRWVNNAHPTEVMGFVEAVGYAPARCRDPWAGLRRDFRGLHDELESWGKDYSHSFISCVRSHWLVVGMPWEHVMYAEGISDGQKWALETPHQELVDKLRSMVTSDPNAVFPNTSREDRWEFTSPAHKLVAAVLGDKYPRSAPTDGDEIGLTVSDCDEFKEFWQPFVDVPMDQVVKILSDPISFTCKLESSRYVTGFIDGAVGISNSLKAKHLPEARLKYVIDC